MSTRKEHKRLTDRERDEVVKLYEMGFSQQRIADEFGVDQKTVSNMLAREDVPTGLYRDPPRTALGLDADPDDIDAESTFGGRLSDGFRDDRDDDELVGEAWE